MKIKIIYFLLIVFSFLYAVEELKIPQGEIDPALIRDMNSLSLDYLADSPQEAIKNSKQALQLAIKAGNKEEECNSLKIIGQGYLALQNYPEADNYFQKALKLSYQIMNKQYCPEILKNLGILKSQTGNFREALDYFSRSLDIAERKNDKIEVAKLMNLMGKVYQSMNDFSKAKEYYRQAAQIEEHFIKENILEIYLKRYKAYLAAGDNENALKYFEKYTALKDSLQADKSYYNIDNFLTKKELAEKEKTIQNLQTEKEVIAQQNKQKEVKIKRLIQDKKQLDTRLDEIKKKVKLTAQELEILRKNKKIKELQLAKQRTILIAIIVISGMILVLLFVILNRYRMKKKISEELEAKNKELQKAYKQLDHLARTDPLTNLSNRRDMLEKLEYEKHRSKRSKSPFVLIMADIDDFKYINDNYGHDAGDYVLVKLSNLMRNIIRKQDIIARWGGEEFLLFLPETDIFGGKILAEKIRKHIINTRFEFKGKKVPVSVTFGVSEYNNNLTLDDCITKADKALYEGKKKGKNCVVLGI